MSRPRYEGFGADLTTLEEKLAALENALAENFSEKIAKNKMKEPAKTYYESMKATLTSLQKSIDVIKNGKEPTDSDKYSQDQKTAYNTEQNKAWKNICDSIQEYRPGTMPRIPHKGDGEKATDESVEKRIKDHEEAFTKELDDPDVRRIWDLSQQLSDLSLDTDMMTQRDKYQSLKGEIDEHHAKVQQFDKELHEFDANITQFKSYEEVIRAKTDAQKSMDAARKAHNEQFSEEKNEELQELREQHRKNLEIKIKTENELNEQMKVSQGKLYGYHEEIKKLDDQIKEEAQKDIQRKAETKRLQIEVDTNKRKLPDLEEEITTYDENAEKYRQESERGRESFADSKKELGDYWNEEINTTRYATMINDRKDFTDKEQAAANETALANYYADRGDALKMFDDYRRDMNESTNISATNKKYTELFRKRFNIDKKTINKIGDNLGAYIQSKARNCEQAIKATLEADASLTKLYKEAGDLHKQRIEEIQRLGNERNSEGLKQYTNGNNNRKIYKDLHDNQSKKLSDGAKSAAENEVDLAYAYDHEIEAAQVYAEYRMKLEAAGFDKLSPVEREQLLSSGHRYEVIEESTAMQQLKKNNTKVRDAFKMRDIHNEFCKALKEVCGAADESVAEAMASTETLEYHLNGTVKAYRKQQEEIISRDKDLKLDPDEQAIHENSMGRIGQIYMQVRIQEEVMRRTESLYKTNLLRAETARMSKSELEAQNAEYMERIKKNEAGGDLPKYMQEKADWTLKANYEKQEYDKLNAAKAKLATINDTTTEKIKALEDSRANAKWELDKATEHWMKASACENKTTTLINQQEDLVNSRRKLDTKLNPKGENSVVFTMWDESCHGIENKMQSFRDTANYGKDAGHKDGQHYQEMMRKLDNFLVIAGGGMVGTSPEALQQALTNVGTAAQEYINTRNKDWFKSNSTIRQTRMAYAERLVKYTTKAAENLQKMVTEDKSLKDKERVLNSNTTDQSSYQKNLFDNMKVIAKENISKEKGNARQAELLKALQQNKQMEQNGVNNGQINRKPPVVGFGKA